MQTVTLSKAELAILLRKDNKAILSIPDIMERTGWGRTKIYEAINSGKLQTIKVGRRRGSTINQFNEFIERLELRGEDDE